MEREPRGGRGGPAHARVPSISESRHGRWCLHRRRRAPGLHLGGVLQEPHRCLGWDRAGGVTQRKRLDMQSLPRLIITFRSASQKERCARAELMAVTSISITRTHPDKLRTKSLTRGDGVAWPEVRPPPPPPCASASGRARRPAAEAPPPRWPPPGVIAVQVTRVPWTAVLRTRSSWSSWSFCLPNAMGFSAKYPLKNRHFLPGATPSVALSLTRSLTHPLPLAVSKGALREL